MLCMVKIVLICILLLFFSHLGFAQAVDSEKVIDSLYEEFLTVQSKKLKEIEILTRQDSLKKLELVSKIESLPSTSNSKKKELLKQLEQLKNIEAERISRKLQKIDSLRHFVKGYAVVPFLDDTLFYIYNKLGSLSAKDRAEAITNRIRRIVDNYYFNTDSLKIVPTETTVDIVLGESITMSISENDALWQSTSKQSLATQYKSIIGRAVISYRQAISWKTIAKEIGLAILVLIGLGAFIYFKGKLFHFTKFKIEAQKDRHLYGIKIRNYELFSVDSQLNFLLWINKGVKWFVTIMAVYFTLPILFSIFPWTEGFANTLISYILNPVKNILSNLWNYLPNLFTIIVIVFIFRYIIKGVQYLKSEIEKGSLQIPGFYPDWANPTFQIMKILLYAFMFIVVFPYLPGSDSPVFQGVSVFLGVLFTFGSSGSLSNVVAGLVLTYMRAFKIGDRVKIGDITGDIIEKSLLVTRIRTIKNEIISVPNSNVMSSHTINYSSDSLEKGLIMHTTITIGYDAPWKNIHQALIDAASRTEYLLQEPKPFVLQISLDDFYVSYQINAYTREPNKQAIIYSQLHQNIQDCCNEVGIEILSPHYRAARDGNMTTIPSNYLGKDYKAGSFNIKIEKDEK